jgi:exo-1,4-beta-D-glucosaminidase
VRARVFDFSLQSLFDKTIPVETLDADSSSPLFEIPALANLTKTYFLKLTVTDHTGTELSNNFYWLSTQEEIYDWKKTDYTHTAMTQDADLTLLNSLPKVKLDVTPSVDPTTKTGKVILHNSSNQLAFFTELKLVDKQSGNEVLPTLWDDNDVSLLPGETREIHFSYPLADGATNVEVAVQ